MRYREPNYLFSKADLFPVIENQKNEIKKEIDGFEQNRLLNSSIEDLGCYFEEKYQLDVPVLQEDHAEVDQNEASIMAFDHFRRQPISITGTKVELFVPFIGDANLFQVRPSTFSSMTPVGSVENDRLVITIQGPQLNPEQVKRELGQQLAEIKKHLNWLQEGVVVFNTQIKDFARAVIQQRRQKLLADQSLVAGLGFTLKKRPDAEKTFTAPIQRKKVVPKLPPANTTSYKPEPILDEAIYQNILDTMSNMAIVMERSPSTFVDTDEEDLRQHFLVQLNGQYDGQATGETFNHQGKTDILIRTEGRNIFIAECKYWHGESAHADTIDQILSYLSWRDTKAAIIIFNRNKNFSDVLTKIQEATKAHPLCKAGPKVQDETIFRFVFGQKNDPSREVILTILTFDVPQSEQAVA
jgi:hypothetical protein